MALSISLSFRVTGQLFLPLLVSLTVCSAKLGNKMGNVSRTTKSFLPPPVEESTRNTKDYQRKPGNLEISGKLVQGSIQKSNECLPKSTICHSCRPLPQPFETSSRSFKCPKNKLLDSKINCDESLRKMSKEWNVGKPVGGLLQDPIASMKPSKRQAIGYLKATGDLDWVDTGDRSGASQGTP